MKISNWKFGFKKTSYLLFFDVGAKKSSNNIETLMRRKVLLNENWSDRWISEEQFNESKQQFSFWRKWLQYDFIMRFTSVYIPDIFNNCIHPIGVNCISRAGDTSPIRRWLNYQNNKKQTGFPTTNYLHLLLDSCRRPTLADRICYRPTPLAPPPHLWHAWFALDRFLLKIEREENSTG